MRTTTKTPRLEFYQKELRRLNRKLNNKTLTERERNIIKGEIEYFEKRVRELK